MVVVSLVALATTGVALALRDSSASQLDREAQRMTALLEAARAQARTTGVAATWQSVPGGFAINQTERPWLVPDTTALIESSVEALQALPSKPAPPPSQRIILGPEPLMSPTSLRLTVQGRSLWLSTDGLRPFSVNATPDETLVPRK